MGARAGAEEVNPSCRGVGQHRGARGQQQWECRGGQRPVFGGHMDPRDSSGGDQQ